MNTEALDNLYKQIQAEEKALLLSRINEAFSKAPRLKALDQERAQLLCDVGSRKIDAKTGMERLQSIDAEEHSILLAIGMSADSLALHVRCSICNDTGYINGTHQPCSCRLLYREQLKATNNINSDEVFSNFLTDIFPTLEQKRNAINAKMICETYAKSLPTPTKQNIFLLGMPGLGKTFLCNAIGYEAIQKGINSERVTTYSIIQTVMKDIRERTDSALRYQNIPLLIIDDIGSEPIIPNVTNEWLFSIINERILTKRPTVFSSNLTLTQLQDKYGERFMSRLCDRNTTQLLQLVGNNLRVIK